jgi:hypothetical protein
MIEKLATVIALAVAASSGCAVDQVIEPDTDEWDDKLGERVVDHGTALRIAALRLTGELPTLAEIKRVAGAGDLAARDAAYRAQIRDYIDGPRFARQMFAFWQDTLKMGGDPELDSAAAFVARIAVENRSFLDALTARAGTCPSFDPATGAFADSDCGGGAPVTAGLLTHPGMNRHFFSNYAFRRVRWVQETFACTAFPAETADAAVEVGGAMPYTGTFPFTSIAGFDNGGRTDFLDRSSVICANCHSNMNHIAPLFARFDAGGAYVADGPYAVPTPLPENPPAVRTDYLPDGEPTAWRHGVVVGDLPALGSAMAADPEIASCAIARLWNWALGKTDIVETMTTVPAATIRSQVDVFVANGHRLGDAIYAIYTADDFIKF